jgi:hypothetical protein
MLIIFIILAILALVLYFAAGLAIMELCAWFGLAAILMWIAGWCQGVRQNPRA